MDAQRALLDELMGASRNLTEEERKGYKELTWDDKEVCRFYMVRFCPHDLFVNTRSDLGPCPKVHDPKLKESFEKSPRHDSYVPKFEGELAHFCEKLVMDLDRRVRRGRERLDQEDVPPPPPPISAEKSEQLSVLEEKIKNLLEQVESLGEAGQVDEAEALMRKVELLNVEKTALTQQSQQSNVLMMAQEKKMALCETCGSFLIANDAAERTQSHVTGKQHVGYGMVRDFLNGRGARDRDRGSDWKYSNSRNGRDRNRERDRSRSRSPVRPSHRSSTKSPVHQSLLRLYDLSSINVEEKGLRWMVEDFDEPFSLHLQRMEKTSMSHDGKELSCRVVALREASKTDDLLVKQSATVRICNAPWTNDHSSSFDMKSTLRELESLLSDPISFFEPTASASNPHTALSDFKLSCKVEMYCSITSSRARISSSASEPPVKLMHLSTAASRSKMICGIDSSILRTVSLSSTP
nr:luc7-like protein 3 [Ipomoea batatas]